MFETFQRNEYLISTDPAKFDLDAIHAYLVRAYWSQGIPRTTVERAVANSLCFALLHGKAQVGFGRVVTVRISLARIEARCSSQRPQSFQRPILFARRFLRNGRLISR